MNKFAKTVMCMALVSCVSVLSVVSPAVGVETITIGNADDLWPTSPLLETFDPTAETFISSSSIYQNRVIGQSFQVSESVYATSAFFEMKYYFGHSSPTNTYDIKLYEVADTTVGGTNDPGLGTLVAQGLGLVASPYSNNVFQVIRFDFDSPVVLSAQTAPAGYAFTFQVTAVSYESFLLALKSTYQGIGEFSANVNGKEFYYNTDAQHTDTAFALVGTPVPEPASLALLSLGGLLMLRRRQNV